MHCDAAGNLHSYAGAAGQTRNRKGEAMSHFYDPQQHAALQNPYQWGTFGAFNPAMSQAYGQPFGQFGQQFSQSNLGQPSLGQPSLGAFGVMQPQWQQVSQQPWQQLWQQPWQQRQLSQQDVGDVVRQLLPILPQILAQAQPVAMGYGFGQQRSLTPQDVNEVVRQILTIVPQIAATLQGHTPAAVAAMYGGYGAQQNPYALNPYAQNPFANPWAQATAQNPFGQAPFAHLMQQQPFGQPAWPAFQSAFGAGQTWNPLQQQQRTLTPNDVNEVVRQLVGIIPQAIANLQSLNQQRVI